MLKNLLKNFYVAKILNKGKVKICKGAKVSKNSSFEGKNYIGRKTTFVGNMGYASYIGDNSNIFGDVGKFCSIASGVKVVQGFHPTTEFVSTHPAFYSSQHSSSCTFSNTQKFNEFKYADNEKKIPVIIENDVWICENAIILAGVKIGNGAIVAAGAIVTKDVEPFSIVAGCPAKEIKRRFNENQIKFLRNFKWWDKDVDWIKENYEDFDNIEDFIEKYDNK